MAKSSTYRWRGWRVEEGGKAITAPTRKRKRRGITNAQAKYLASLQRQLDVSYTGAGMTASEASAAINAAKRALKRHGDC